MTDTLSTDILSKDNNSKKGIWIKTYGCQMNEYDSEKVLALLSKDYKLVDTPEQAEIAFVNTCSVRDKAEQKLYSLLGVLRDIKKEKQANNNTNYVIGVGGCVAQQEGKTIVSRSPTVDFVVGTHNLSLVPSLVKQAKEEGKKSVAVNYREEWEELSPEIEQYTKDVTSGARSFRALVSIQRGCSKHCTFCVVQTTRGEQVSRAKEEILREIKLKVNLGAKEVLLLGQTVNSYGLDLKPRIKFENLVREIAEIEGVSRIRFISPHPQEVKPGFIELYGDLKQLCPHIHLPLQSGSDRILKLMNRNYRKKRYLEIVQALKQKLPDISITTDIIVGFPTETEEDFNETLEVMKEVAFTSSFTFKYSRRPNTKALSYSIEDEVPNEVAHQRLLKLQALQDEIAAENNKKWLDREVEVLVEGKIKNKENSVRGRIPQGILVELISAANKNSVKQREILPGELLRAKINYTSAHGLRGELLDE